MTDSILKNAIKITNSLSQEHPARVALRKMVISGFLIVPNNLKRNIIYEQKMISQNSHPIGPHNTKNKIAEENKKKKSKSHRKFMSA